MEKTRNTTIYYRVSAAKQKSNLKTQIDALLKQVVKDGLKHRIYINIGSSLNYKRPQFLKLLIENRLKNNCVIMGLHKKRSNRGKVLLPSSPFRNHACGFPRTWLAPCEPDTCHHVPCVQTSRLDTKVPVSPPVL